jgi:hypothetical protein
LLTAIQCQAPYNYSAVTITQNVYAVTLLHTTAIAPPSLHLVPTLVSPLKFSHLPLYVLKFLDFFEFRAPNLILIFSFLINFYFSSKIYLPTSAFEILEIPDWHFTHLGIVYLFGSILSILRVLMTVRFYGVRRCLD